MRFRNKPRQFYTQPPNDNTSKYYVFENGLVRARMAVNRKDGEPPTIMVRPGKNICYVAREARVHRDQPEGTSRVRGLGLRYIDAMDLNGQFQVGSVGIHKTLDFYLDDRARLVKGFHRGHDICAAFDAT